MSTLTFPHMHGSVLRPKLLFAVTLLGHKLRASLGQTEMSVLWMPLCSPSHTAGGITSMPPLLVIKARGLAYAVQYLCVCVCVLCVCTMGTTRWDSKPRSGKDTSMLSVTQIQGKQRPPAAKACCPSIRQEPACGQGQTDTPYHTKPNDFQQLQEPHSKLLSRVTVLVSRMFSLVSGAELWRLRVLSGQCNKQPKEAESLLMRRWSRRYNTE